MLVHVIMFKLKDRSADNIAETRDVLLGMEDNIPQLRAIEVGTNIVESNRAYDLVLVTKFDSLDAMQSYQVHPYHENVVRVHMRKVVNGTASVDYETVSHLPQYLLITQLYILTEYRPTNVAHAGTSILCVAQDSQNASPS